MPNLIKHKSDQPPPVQFTAESLARLALRFTLGTLTPEEVNHRVHIAVIAWLLLLNDEASATQRVVSGLRSLDRAGCPSLAPSRRYNETVTGFWITVVRRHLTMRVHYTDAAQAVAAVVEQFGDQPELVYRYFSRNRVHSWEARSRWVEPDRRPLPSAQDFTDRLDS